MGGLKLITSNEDEAEIRIHFPSKNCATFGYLSSHSDITWQTYDNVDIFPQAHLNLTIGPNGTGKSTIMCAIFLVCGGTPKCLGRSTQMIDYIKHGKNSAHVQAELVGHAGHSNPIIDLFLRRSGSSAKYHLNGKEIARQKSFTT
uniref:Structural maintenance of chromosomes protein 5 n=1 Tax=Romanomermis culicivorax TaxID=13658 RepID=A0A915KNH1_ROMCU